MPKSFEDIVLWSDGTWCYRYELSEMSHLSDDYEVISYGTYQHQQLLEEHGSFA